MPSTFLRFSWRNTASHSCRSLPLGAARGRSEERTSTEKFWFFPAFALAHLATSARAPRRHIFLF